MHTVSATPTAALDVDNVSHRYGARLALDRVAFSVAPASFTVLLGLNGAGKSTLFSLITRLYATRSGHIRIFGHDIARETGAALRQLGVVFQSRALDVDISIQQNLDYHAALHGIGKAKAIALTGQALKSVALAERAKDKVSVLSGGQMRRVEIARALLHRPRLLLLDEATAGLDINARADILDHVRRLVSEEAIGVLWATHLIDEVGAADNVVVLHNGCVLAHGSAETIMNATGETSMRGAFARLTAETAGLDQSGTAA